MANPIQLNTFQGAYAITPSDTMVYSRMFSSLFVGGAGNVAVRTVNGDNITFTGVTAGQVLSIKGDMVLSTGTTATSIVGMTQGARANDLSTWGPLTDAPITAWGDSLTKGTGSNLGNKTYPNAANSRLATLIIPKNRGIGGQTSTQIAARQGGRQVLVTIAGNSIPASGGVSVTNKNINVLFEAGVFTGTIDCSIAGISGTMSTDVSGNWTFTRAAPGAITAVSPNTQCVIQEAVLYKNDTQWIMAGRNNPTDVSTVLSDIAAMVSYIGHTRYRILSVLPSADDSSTVLDFIDEINESLLSIYGHRYVNIISYLVSANDGSANDLADIAARLIPRSLRSDAVHLNGLGYETVGIAVAMSYNVADRDFSPSLGIADAFGEFDSVSGWTIGAGWSISEGRLFRDTSGGSEIIRTVPALVNGQTYRVIIRGYTPVVNVRNGSQYLTVAEDQKYIDFVASAQTFGFQTGSALELLNVSILPI